MPVSNIYKEVVYYWLKNVPMMSAHFLFKLICKCGGSFVIEFVEIDLNEWCYNETDLYTWEQGRDQSFKGDEWPNAKIITNSECEGSLPCLRGAFFHQLSANEPDLKKLTTAPWPFGSFCSKLLSFAPSVFAGLWWQKDHGSDFWRVQKAQTIKSFIYSHSIIGIRETI